MRRLLAVLACGLLTFTLSAAAQQPTASAPKLEKFDPALIDKDIDPCTDYFQYTCSKWNATHPISPDLPAHTTATPLLLWNQTILRETLEKAAADKSATGSERQIGDYWQACMDQAGRDANGKNWLAAELKVIDGLKSKKDLARVLAHMHQTFPAAWQGQDNFTNAPVFGFGPAQDYADASKVVSGVDQAGVGLPSRDHYLDNSERMKQIRQAYVKHVQQMMELAGESPAQAAKDAQIVMVMETAFATAAMDNVKRRSPENTYNKRTLAQIKSAVPSFDWDAYFKALNAPAPEFYIVSAPQFMDALEQEIKSRPIESWKAYLRWWAVHSAAGLLGEDFVQANFDFYGKTLSGVPRILPLWRRCVQSADRSLGEALGQAYVNRAFPPESKAKAVELVRDIRTALNRDIQELEWMTPATKKQAAVKLEAMEQKIGYPDQWRDYSSVKITPNNHLANVAAATAFEMQRQLKKIGKPVDRTEWLMTPPTINAYNDPQKNSINFPAGILQLPFFNGEQDAPLNYGAIGMVIGHEIIHGFDDEGRKFDAKGDLRDWWTPEDTKNYEERGNCIAKQYTGEDAITGAQRNGRLTQGEDTADNGGIRLAMMALEEKYKRDGKSLDTPEADGLTARQRFFHAYAFAWCRNVRPESERLQIATDPHSLARYRVNGPLSNLPEFWQTYGCKPGKKMVNQPTCRVW